MSASRQTIEAAEAGHTEQKRYPLRRLKEVNSSLRTRVVLGITLPIFITLVALSVVHYWREHQVMMRQIQLTAEQIGDIVLGSLRHGMLTNDGEMIARMTADMGIMENISQVQILDNHGVVRANSNPAVVGVDQTPLDAGCEECHQYPAQGRPRTVLLSDKNGVMRIATPVINEEECQDCHRQDPAHLGMLLIDVSLFNSEVRLLEDLRIDLLISVTATIIFTAGIYLLIHRLILGRVEAIQAPLEMYAQGDFSARLPSPKKPFDELDNLALTFNHMADELARKAQEEEERSQIRIRSIIEERERLARELHDGLAQLLGYVSTKAGAVRLLLKGERFEEAGNQLLQLEAAAGELFTETRETILGLKKYGESGAGFSDTLREFSAQFTRLSEMPVQTRISPKVELLDLNVEVQLQLLRIAQEALTNVRKHSFATQAWVRLEQQNGTLELEIKDNGTGFDIGKSSQNGDTRLGVEIMKERATSIGAEIVIASKHGSGTSIQVFFPLNGR